jgi:hypothetical protein
LATGKSASFIARKVASSSESRLTVMRSRPAARSASACAFSAEPLVVSVRSTSGSASRSNRDEAVDPAPQQRLAAGEADLARAVRVEDAREPHDLLEREDLRVRQEGVVGAEDLARHAVRAAEIAAVGDRDAQVVQLAPRAYRRAGLRGARRSRRESAIRVVLRAGR